MVPVEGGTSSTAAVDAWVRLIRAEQRLRSAVEADLKSAGLPPLDWYDVLLELSRAPEGRLRPFELEKRLLLAQYNLSRLADRMQRHGLVERVGCPEDKRGQYVAITEAGRDAKARMWPVYRCAVQEAVGGKLTHDELVQLGWLLAKLI